MHRAERITPPVAHHGEGPFWDERNNRLLCMDVLAGTIIAIDSKGGVDRYQSPSSVVTVIRRRAEGGYVIATERGVVVSDDQFSAFASIAELDDNTAVRTNDGGCDHLGGFVIGTMAYDEQPGAGAVYRITPDRRIVRLLSPVSISNGVQWSADGTRVYYVDSPTRRVDAFEVDHGTGAWSERRTHIEIDEPAGFPDGMAIDEEDGLWVALWGAGAVNHYDNTGRLVETFEVPGVTQVSSCAFGGDDRGVLYITTSRQGVADGREPNAGAVFAVQTRSRGAVQAHYAG
jgi:sugar lactone lactonase YvrE